MNRDQNRECETGASDTNSYVSAIYKTPGPEVIKLFSCSTQLSMKFKMLKDIKIAIINGNFTFEWPKPIIYPANKQFVGILTIMSRINFDLSWVEHEKSFITSGPVVGADSNYFSICFDQELIQVIIILSSNLNYYPLSQKTFHLLL